jgi:hypothetical protein
MAFYLRRVIIVVSPDGEELTSNYIVRHFDRYARDPHSTLRPPSWLAKALDGSRRRLFIVRSDDRINRALVQQRGGRLVATGARFVAYTMPP